MNRTAAAGPPVPRMLLSVNEVAAELGCGRDTVYALIAKGHLPSLTISGRLRRVRREDLLAYIDSRVPSTPSR